MSKYRIEETTDLERWDGLVDDSKQGTIFSKSIYLNSFGGKYKLLFVFKGNELRAGIPLILSEDEKRVVLDDLVIYGGILFNKPTNKQNMAQQYSEQFRISEFIAKYLIGEYQHVSIALHPSFIDIRSFLWVNYGKTDVPKYNVDIRYTSYLYISDFADNKLDDIVAYRNSSTARRQEIRYAIRDGVFTEESKDVEKFIDFYKQTISIDEVAEKESRFSDMKKIVTNLIKNNFGKIFFSYTKNGQLGSSAFFGIDNKRAYYIFGANDKSLVKSHTGTAILWDSFHQLSHIGIKEIDLEGINSPHRGWFKLSFGGDIRPYYQVNIGGK